MERVIGDFEEMKALGANVVRVHLQFGRFMNTPDEPNQKELDRLEKLLALAEHTGLYLDITGLGSYHKQDVPNCYRKMGETERLDFIALHLYPKGDQLEQALKTLKGFDIGKPLVIEETFPLHTSHEQFRQFLRRSRKHADGWISFYWGTPPTELRKREGIKPAMHAAAIETFVGMKEALIEP